MLRVIATFILIYLLFRVLTAYVFPLIARWYINRYQKRFYRQNPWAAKAEEKRRQQEKERQGQNKKPDTDKLGEYVDYEEINDD